jgi:hypothetical protein
LLLLVSGVYFHFMSTITVEELEEQEKRLEREIAEKQELLEALRKTRLYITGGTNGQRDVPSRKGSAPKIGYGHNTKLVKAVIRQMTRNYTVRDIRRSLTNEGNPLSAASITTVINRLKRNRDIIEIRKGKGRKPALFKKP